MGYSRLVHTAALVFVVLVAVEHVYFALLEMVLWTKPRGLKTFNITEAFAKESAGLAMNQGLYNLFLVAGLVWGLVSGGRPVEIFFLACVVVAGLFGGATVNKRILFVQAGPAAIGLALVLFS